MHGCEVTVLMNVATVLDGDLSTFDSMCEQLDRAPGTYLTAEQKYRWALEKQQYIVRRVCPFSDERLKNEGAEYAVQHYKDILTFPFDLPAVRDYYTDDRIADIAAGNPQLDALLEPYQRAGRYHIEERYVGVGDIAAAIDDKSTSE